jgi:hypothetical protein
MATISMQPSGDADTSVTAVSETRLQAYLHTTSPDSPGWLTQSLRWQAYLHEHPIVPKLTWKAHSAMLHVTVDGDDASEAFKATRLSASERAQLQRLVGRARFVKDDALELAHWIPQLVKHVERQWLRHTTQFLHTNLHCVFVAREVQCVVPSEAERRALHIPDKAGRSVQVRLIADGAYSLHAWLRTQPSPNDLVAVLVQLLYTMECLTRCGVVLTEFTAGDIRLVVLDRAETVCLNLSPLPDADAADVVRVRSACQVRLRQWDTQCYAPMLHPSRYVEQERGMHVTWTQAVDNHNWENALVAVLCAVHLCIQETARTGEAHATLPALVGLCQRLVPRHVWEAAATPTSWSHWQRHPTFALASERDAERDIPRGVHGIKQLLHHLEHTDAAHDTDATGADALVYALPPVFFVVQRAPRLDWFDEPTTSTGASLEAFCTGAPPPDHPLTEDDFTDLIASYHLEDLSLRGWNEVHPDDAWVWSWSAEQLWRTMAPHLRAQNWAHHELVPLACLLVTCPLYYGMEAERRRVLRDKLIHHRNTRVHNPVATSDSREAETCAVSCTPLTGSHLLGAEDMIWCVHRILPVSIPHIL